MEAINNPHPPQTSSFEDYLKTAYQHRPVEDQDVSITWLDAPVEPLFDHYQDPAYAFEPLVIDNETLNVSAPYDYETDDIKGWTNMFKTQPVEVSPVISESLPMSAAEKRLVRLKTAAAKIGNLFSPVLETALEDTNYFSETEAVTEATSPERRTGRIKTAATYIGNLALKSIDWLNDRKPETQLSSRSRKGLIAATGLAMTGALVAGPAMDLVDGYIKLQNKSSITKNKVSASPVSQAANAQVPTIEFKGLPDAPVIDMNDVLSQVEKNRIAAAEANTPKVDLNAIAAQRIEENARIKQQEAEAAAKAHEAEHAAEEAKRALQAEAEDHTHEESEIREYSVAEIKQIIRDAARKYGVSAEMLIAKAECESQFTPSAINYGYEEKGKGHPAGLFQHLQGYWAARAAMYGYEGASVHDPVANANVTAGMHRDGQAHLWEC